jgi:acyl-CoA synthetase (AMP-forming)/AMP-acid ligase II
MISLFHGIISGNRKRSHDEVAERAERIASGLKSLGVAQGDSVCMLLRNDIAFIEAAYAAMRRGAGEALMAVVEPRPGAALDVADIRAKLKTSLADYKVPKHIEIATNLPREDSGKIFKRRLRDPYWERAGRRI